MAKRQSQDPAWRDLILASPATFRDAFEAELVDEIDGSGLPRVLLSDEAVFGSSEGSMQLLATSSGGSGPTCGSSATSGGRTTT